jgi:allophanate hydrolase subunit 2
MIAVEVLHPGPLALVEDLGRPGLAEIGVTHSGAADRGSHTLANRLLANPEGCATIEITQGGFRARVPGRPSRAFLSAPTVSGTSTPAR